MAAPRTVTLGCRLNAFESEVMRGLAAGLDDTIIVNTCAVTAEAERQARQSIRRLRRRNPGARIIVTGCAAQLDPEGFAAMPEVDRVLGNADKLDAASFDAARLDDGRRLRVSDIAAARAAAPPLIDGFDGRARAFVQVQQGCDHRCTFCIIPRARGPARSVPAAAVVRQVRRLVARGYAEVVLTGVDLCSWGADMAGAEGLGGLVRQLLAEVPALRRLRLSTADPAAVDADLVRLLGEEPRLMPHLHLSLQSGDDLVLKRMKRRHDRAGAAALCRSLRRARPDIVLGADLIAGFPTETEAMFANTMGAIEDLGLTFLHVFPYSPRPGTPAARMPQVATEARRRRAAALRAAGEHALRRTLASLLGSRAEVLVERGRRGRSQHYAPVELAFDAAPGSVVPVRISAAGDHLVGQRAP